MDRRLQAALATLLACGALLAGATPAMAQGALDGNVRDQATNLGVNGVCVTLYSAANSSIVTQRVASQGGSGFWNMTSVPSGSYKLGFSTDIATTTGGNNGGFCGSTTNPIVPEFHENKADFVNADAFFVSDGSFRRFTTQVALVPGGIVGQLKDANNATLQGICVQALAQANENTVAASGVTNSSGVYSFDVPPGTYKVLFRDDDPCGDPGSRVVREYYNDKASFALANTVTVTGANATSNINAVLNTRPTAGDDSVSVGEDAGQELAVLGNDVDIDPGDQIEIESVTDPPHGSASVTQGSPDRIAYTPDADYCGADTFGYTIGAGDAFAAGDTAAVSVTVECVDDGPAAVADAKTLDEDAGATTVDVLANDTDVDTGSKSIQSKTDGAHGAVAITNGGADLTYTPEANFCGSDTFTYALNGGSSATVTVTVTCIDDPPTAVGDSKTVGPGAATPIDVLANDTDGDGGPRTVSAVGAAGHGTVAVAGDGSGVTYTPSAGYCGPDSFDYTLAGGSSAPVAIQVTCLDLTAPETRITKRPKKKVVTRRKRARVRFAFVSTEVGSTFGCRIDRGKLKPCVPAVSYRLKRGRHTFQVFATDGAGNADQSPAKWRFRIVRRRPN